MENGFKGIRNENGRPPGAKNVNSKIVKELITQQLNSHLNRIDEYLEQVNNPATKLKLLAEFLPYITARLKSESIELTPGQKIPDYIHIEIVN